MLTCDLHCTVSRVTLCKRLQVVHKEVSTIFYSNLRTCPAAFVHTNLCVFGLALCQIGMCTIFQPSCTHRPTMIFEFNTSIWFCQHCASRSNYTIPTRAFPVERAVIVPGVVAVINVFPVKEVDLSRLSVQRVIVRTSILICQDALFNGVSNCLHFY